MPNRKVAIRDALTGIRGLDDVLGGGLTPNRLYLLEGMPGSGKTTLAFQFLMEGVRQGENVLYVTLSETEEEIRAVAQTHGWSLDGIAVRELVPTQENLEPDEQYTMFHPSEVELSDTTRKILEDVERIKPSRLVFDSLSELRLLAGNPLRYRRQILALKHYFSGRQCTVLLLDDLTGEGHDLQVQSIAHGVLLLQQHAPDYGKQRRRLNVLKYRGRAFRGGYHDYVIRRGGLDVFPRLVAAEHRTRPGQGRIAAGIEGLDALLGGGLDRGTSVLLMGAAQQCIKPWQVGIDLFDRAVAPEVRSDQPWEQFDPAGADLVIVEATDEGAATQLADAQPAPVATVVGPHLAQHHRAVDDGVDRCALLDAVGIVQQ